MGTINIKIDDETHEMFAYTAKLAKVDKKVNGKIVLDKNKKAVKRSKTQAEIFIEMWKDYKGLKAQLATIKKMKEDEAEATAAKSKKNIISMEELKAKAQKARNKAEADIRKANKALGIKPKPTPKKTAVKKAEKKAEKAKG